MAATAKAGLMRDRPSLRWIAGGLMRTGLLRPRSLAAFTHAVYVSGANLVALLRFGASLNANARLIDDHEAVSFRDLAMQAEMLAVELRHHHGVVTGQAIGILGQNSVALVRALLAASRLGARSILLNPHLPALQIEQLMDRHQVTLLLAPHGSGAVTAKTDIVLCDPENLLRDRARTTPGLPRITGGEIILLTGGTTGLPKAAKRIVAPAAVLRVFLHLIAALQLQRRQSVYVATPLFHGFGLAALLVAIALGRTVHVRRRFDAATTAELVERYGIDTMAVVPTMLHRFLSVSTATTPLRCIVSGGAPLLPALVEQAQDRLGDILFNLYGTSEAGLSALATPRDLAACPDTIGRAIWGADIMVRTAADMPASSGHIGELCVRNRASVAARAWIATGDLASRNRDGLLFLHGRTDDMIVSGGENVIPWEIETVLLTHPQVADAVAIGVPDSDFGARLVAVVVPVEGIALDSVALQAWLVPLLARHQMPREIAVRECLPLTTIGKVDRRALRLEFETAASAHLPRPA